MIMLATTMSTCKTNGTRARRESARLELGELIMLADEFSHRSIQLRREGRRIVDKLSADMLALCTTEDVSITNCSEADRGAFSAARNELIAGWLQADSIVDDLLSSAVDELARFTTLAEARIGAFERSVYHRQVSRQASREARNEFRGVSGSAGPISNSDKKP